MYNKIIFFNSFISRKGGFREIKLSTNDLFLMIENISDLGKTWDNLTPHMKTPIFKDYLYELMKQHGLDAGRLVVKSLLSRSFAYQICSGERQPSRDIVLRIAIAMGASVDETQQLLRLAQRGTLYPRDPRDAVIIYALSRGLDLYEADELLSQMEQQTLL